MSDCPLCQERVEEAHYEQHVERCLTGLIEDAESELLQMHSSSSSASASSSSTFQQQPRPVPKTAAEEDILETERVSPDSLTVWIQGRLTDLQETLKAAGFLTYGAMSCHPTSNVTIELNKLSKSLGKRGWAGSIVVDGVLENDLADRLRLSVPKDTAINGPEGPALCSWLSDLLLWVRSQREVEAPGFSVDHDTTEETFCQQEEDDPAFRYLPTAAELNVTADRPLHILTWGRALMKTAPHTSQHTFNAAVLNGRGGGVDLKKFNGLSEGVQHNVARCSLFPEWLRLVCSAIEKNNYTCVSIVCTKGRHRSVAAAEILQRLYYPEAIINHLTIK